MKHMKKFLAILLAAVMVMGMSSMVWAAGDTEPTQGEEGGAGDAGEGGEQEQTTTVAYDESVTVSGLAKDDVAHFYKIIKWVGSEDKDNVAGWKAAEGFESVLTKDVLTKVLIGDKDAEDKDPTGITAELAGKLARAAKSATAVADVTVTADSAELNKTVYEDFAEGTYMAIITPSDADTVYNPVFVSSDYTKGGNTHAVSEAASYSDEAAAKKSTTELNKTASTEEAKPDDMKWNTVAIGDTVTFTVTTTIPAFGTVYENPKFVVRDKLTDLTLVAKSVKVKVPTDAVATITEGNDNYSIEFDKDYLKTITTPTDVTIEYQAIVNTDAPLNVNQEKNEVSTEFSHNPSDETDYGFKKDTTQHYTFSLDVETEGEGESGKGKKTSELVKVAQDANGNPITQTVEKSEITEKNTWTSPLAGAKFKLYTDAECKNEYVPKTKEGAAGEPLVIVTEADGRMPIKGLDAGEYWLQEDEAPAGYVKDTKVHHIVITANINDKVSVTEYTKDGQTWKTAAEYDQLSPDEKKEYKSYTYETEVLDSYTVEIDGEKTATYHFTHENSNKAEIDWDVEPPVELPFDIINTKGTELPSTGGIGTTIFYTLGTILVLGAGVLLVVKRRMEAR